MTRDAIRERLAQLVADSSDGETSAEQALPSGLPLSAPGLTSPPRIRLAGAVESEYGPGLDGDGRQLLDGLSAPAARLEHG
jgi:hypothetical protein